MERRGVEDLGKWDEPEKEKSIVNTNIVMNN